MDWLLGRVDQRDFTVLTGRARATGETQGMILSPFLHFSEEYIAIIGYALQ
ncbi:MAG: hypothetical protein ACREYC_27700 [Gammaproteobacteria bacterium]